MTPATKAKLTTLTLDELIKLHADLKKELTKRKARAKKQAAVMAGPIALCRAAGMEEETVAALLSNGSPHAALRAAEKVALARYRK